MFSENVPLQIMPTYKLTYFDGRGLAEPARMLFHLGGVPFEDSRIPVDMKTGLIMNPELADVKKKAPFGKYPVLKIDDIEIAQSAAINRYLARQFGFAGKNPIEEAQADSYIDQCQEYNTSFRACMYATLQGKPEEEVQKIREEVYIPAQNKFYEIFSDILNRNKSGFLVGDSLTWADLVIADHLYSLDTMGMLTHEDAWRCETLKKFQEKIYEHPLLKGYIASRPKGAF